MCAAELVTSVRGARFSFRLYQAVSVRESDQIAMKPHFVRPLSPLPF